MQTVVLTGLISFCVASSCVSSGCTPAQMRAFEQGMQAFAESAEGQQVLADSANWLAQEFVSLDTVSRIDLRQKSGTDVVGNDINLGPVIGSFHLTKVEVEALPQQQIRIAMDGAGYIGNKYAQNATFVCSVDIVYTTRVELFGNEYARIQYFPFEIRKAELTVLRLTRMESTLAKFVMVLIDWYVSLKTSGLVRNFGTSVVGPMAWSVAEQYGLNVLRDRIQSGFTVAFDRSMRARHWVGVGTDDPGLPQKPYPEVAGEKEVVNQYVKLWKRGRLFVGPIKLDAGAVVSISASVDQRKYSWGLDFYLAADREGRQELVSYLDERVLPDEDRPVLAAGTGHSWTTSYTAPVDMSVWVIVDYTNQGRAKMPWLSDQTEALIRVGVR